MTSDPFNYSLSLTVYSGRTLYFISDHFARKGSAGTHPRRRVSVPAFVNLPLPAKFDFLLKTFIFALSILFADTIHKRLASEPLANAE